MVKFSFFLFTVCFSLLTIAQTSHTNAAHSLFDDEDAWRSKMVGIARHYVRFSVGASLPQGLYASVYEKEQAGYAKIGTQFSLNAARYWSANVGICAAAGMYQNQLNNYNYLPDLYRQLPVIPSDGLLQQSNWQHAYLASGVCLTLPEKKFIFDLQLMGGVVHATSPHIVYENPDQNSDPLFEQTSKSNVAVALLISTAVQFPLAANGNWCVVVKGDYVGAKPRFRTTQQINSADYKVSTVNDFRQNISAFNLGIGITRQFKYAPNRKKVYNPN